MNKYSIYLVLSIIIMFAISCNEKKEEPIPTKENGKITLKFSHFVDGLPLKKDSMIYTNAANNEYEINQLMYFISDVILYKSDGSKTIVNKQKDKHYVNIEIPSTLTWEIIDSIPTGNYDSINFVFGFKPEKNISFMYVNPPEVDMMWPNILGGGYHYMMLNGKWKDLNNTTQNFAFHMGIGQLYKNDIVNVDSIYQYVHNNFTVSLPNSSLSIETDKTKVITIKMNIESWFETPSIYDHNYWGGAIMQKQPAMQMIKNNRHDVVSIKSIE